MPTSLRIPQPSFPVTGFAIIFAPTRTVRKTVELLGPSNPDGPVQQLSAGLGVEFWWPRPWVPPSPMELRIEDLGAPSKIGGYRWLTSVRLEEETEQARLAGLQLLSTDSVLDYLRRRDAEIDLEPDEEKRRAKRFFFELDLISNSGVWVEEFAVWNETGRRRADYVAFPEPRSAGPHALGAAQRYFVRSLAAGGLKPSREEDVIFVHLLPFMRRIFEKAFSINGRFSSAAARQGFELFASGRIHSELVYSKLTAPAEPATNCEPDGNNYLQFAEVALVGAEHSPQADDRDFWLALCTFLIWTREIFWQTYINPHAAALPREVDDYNPSFRRDLVPLVDCVAVHADLVRRYESLGTLQELRDRANLLGRFILPTVVRAGS